MDNRNETFHNKRNTLASVSFYQMHLDSPNSSTKDEINFIKSMNEKRYRLKLVGNMSSRIITHYHELGLINDNRSKGKGWRLFSFSELVWLQIIIKLRNFGYDLQKIKRVKDFLEMYRKDMGPSEYPELDFYVGYTQKVDEPVMLLVFDSGEALLGHQMEIDYSLEYQTIQDDYIAINLNRLVGSLMNQRDINIDHIDYGMNDIELELRQTFAMNNLESVMIKTNKKETYLLDKEFSMESEQEMKFFMRRMNYADSVQQKRKGKSIFKVTEKKKIKKK